MLAQDRRTSLSIEEMDDMMQYVDEYVHRTPHLTDAEVISKIMVNHLYSRTEANLIFCHYNSRTRREPAPK